MHKFGDHVLVFRNVHIGAFDVKFYNVMTFGTYYELSGTCDLKVKK